MFTAIPEAQKIIQSADRYGLYPLVGQVFGSSDPFLLPLLEFHGSIGGRNITMLMSRKYVGIESATAGALGSARFGNTVSFSGFGTLTRVSCNP